MRFSIATVILAAAGFAAAQSTTLTSSTAVATSSSGSTKCQAQNILDACLTSTKAQLDACAGNDYGCLCDQYTNVLTCYNNCPNDPNKFGIQQEMTQNCNAKKAYGTTSTVVSAKASKTSGAASGASASASATGGAVASGFGSSSSTGTGAASSSSPTGAAGKVVVSGGMLGAVAAAFGLLL